MSGGIYVPPMTLNLGDSTLPMALSNNLRDDRPASDSRRSSDPGRLASEAAERDAMLERLGLTPRQREVLALLLDGKSNKTIARDLAISVETVKDHVAAVLRTLGVNSRTQAVAVVSRMPLASGSAAAPRRALLR